MRPTNTISRRDLCGGGLLLASCQKRRSPYFGRTTVPERQRLSYVLGAEPDSIDPAYYAGGFEGWVIASLFEGLTAYHPQTMEPIAALATHFEIASGPSPGIVFFLRGHPLPRGNPLPDTGALGRQYQAGILKQDFSRGKSAPPASIAARWSDGSPVTAGDFVYSWRRLADPRTAAPYAYNLTKVRNADAIQAGKLPPDRLGVTAVNDYELLIETNGPPLSLLLLLAIPALAAVPRWVIERARSQGRESAWTDPERIVSNGAFRLTRRIPYERTIVARNQDYYEAGIVALDEIEFVPVSSGVTTANLYRSGDIHAMPGERLSPLLQPTLEGHRDFHVAPACFLICHLFNTRKAPFNNLLLRYAFNMATDKSAIARCYGAGRLPARNIVPPIAGYDAPQSLHVPIDGVTYDVLSYDPEAARALLAKAGYPNGLNRDGRPFRFEVLFPTLPHSRPIAEMLQQQWRRNLNVEPNLVMQEFTVWMESALSLQYSAIAEGGGWPDYLDPKGFFDWFANGSPISATGYSDATFDRMLAEADGDADPAARMRKLAECERHLLTSMPLIPIYHNVWLYLQKPFVRGMEANALDKHPFKYVWIDTNWRPS